MRVVGATCMNKTSSRSHAVFTIYFQEKEVQGGKKRIKNAEINIVDLAGSERQSKTQASGSRLKEGANINKSLTYLGIVIEKLSENASKGTNAHIPFRNSQLTYLLSDALGGNSKTIMIAALSPAAFNYEETLGTLQFADRVAAIKTTSKANVDEEEERKAALLSEIAALKKELADLQKAGDGPQVVEVSEDEGEEEKQPAEDRKKQKKNQKQAQNLELNLKMQEKMLQQIHGNHEEERKNKEDLQKDRDRTLADAGLGNQELMKALNID